MSIQQIYLYLEKTCLLIFQGDTKKIHEVKLEKSSGYAGMNGMPAGKVFNCKKDKKMLT
jgi:hypothetical protein